MNFIDFTIYNIPKSKIMSKKDCKRLTETWNNIEKIYMNDAIEDTKSNEVIYVENDNSFIVNGVIIKENTLTIKEKEELKSKARKMKLLLNNNSSNSNLIF